MIINVLGHQFEQRFLSEENAEEVTFGKIDWDNHIMYSRPGLTNQRYFGTQLHEMFHALLDLTGISYLMDERLQNVICEVMGNNVGPMLAANPEFTKDMLKVFGLEEGILVVDHMTREEFVAMHPNDSLFSGAPGRPVWSAKGWNDHYSITVTPPDRQFQFFNANGELVTSSSASKAKEKPMSTQPTRPEIKAQFKVREQINVLGAEGFSGTLVQQHNGYWAWSITDFFQGGIEVQHNDDIRQAYLPEHKDLALEDLLNEMADFVANRLAEPASAAF